MLKHEHLSCPSGGGGGEGGLLKTEANTLGTLQMLKHEKKTCLVPITPAWSSFKFRQLPREAVENVGLH